MGDDDPTSEAEEVPTIPSRSPLPMPPEVIFKRPAGFDSPSSRGRPASGQNQYGSGAGGDPDTARYGAGLAGSVTFGASIFAGFWLGQQIDSRWNHSQTPWGTIVMVLMGAFVGFYNLLRLVNRGDRTRNKK